MIYLFSTKLALRRAMVGLSNYTGAYPSSGKTIEVIADYLTEGGISNVKALEKQCKSLADQLEGLTEANRVGRNQRDQLLALIKDDNAELSGLRSEIATAQEQLDSLVAQIGAVEFEDQLYKDAALDFKHTPSPQ